MIEVKSPSWMENVSHKLNKLREEGVLCDVVITTCEGAKYCCREESILRSSALEKHTKNVKKETVSTPTKTEKLKAHSNILAASSSVLHTVVSSEKLLPTSVESPCSLHIHSISLREWELLLEFMYLGCVVIELAEDLTALEASAKQFEIKELISGIEDVKKSEEFNSFVLTNDNQVNEEDVGTLAFQKTDCETKTGKESKRKTREGRLRNKTLGKITRKTGRKNSKYQFVDNLTLENKDQVKEQRKKKQIVKKNSVTVRKPRINTSQLKITKSSISKKIKKEKQDETKTDICLSVRQYYEDLPSTVKTEEENLQVDDNTVLVEEVKGIDNCNIDESKSGIPIPPKYESEAGEKLCLLSCKVCGRMFKTQHARNLHLTKHYSKIKSLKKCKSCPKSFLTVHELRAHNRAVHGRRQQGDSLRHCDLCDKTFMRKYDFIVHQRVHSGEKPYSCRHCDKQFSQKPNMIVHEKIHKDDKQHECSVCGKTFLRKWGLQEHEKTHSGLRPYLCQTCGKSFSKICNLQVHERIHSGAKPYACPHCPARFGDPSTRTQHQVIHQDTKAFQCNDCGKQFARGKALKEHQHTHTGEKPYVCSICNAGFANSSNLSRHKKFHVKKKMRKQASKGPKLMNRIDAHVETGLQNTLSDRMKTKLTGIQQHQNFLQERSQREQQHMPHHLLFQEHQQHPNQSLDLRTINPPSQSLKINPIPRSMIPSSTVVGSNNAKQLPTGMHFTDIGALNTNNVSNHVNIQQPHLGQIEEQRMFLSSISEIKPYVMSHQQAIGGDSEKNMGDLLEQRLQQQTHLLGNHDQQNQHRNQAVNTNTTSVTVLDTAVNLVNKVNANNINNITSNSMNPGLHGITNSIDSLNRTSVLSGNKIAHDLNFHHHIDNSNNQLQHDSAKKMVSQVRNSSIADEHDSPKITLGQISTSSVEDITGTTGDNQRVYHHLMPPYQTSMYPSAGPILGPIFQSPQHGQNIAVESNKYSSSAL